MPNDKPIVKGNNLNDPDPRPADAADHGERTQETREEESQMGDRQDVEGHPPNLPAR